MKTNRGFTLIEVIVSIAVLGIISVFFLGAMTSHLSLLTQTKKITKDIFLVQREMEVEVDIVKDKIRKNELTLVQKTIFDSLGGLEVNYYGVSKNLNNREYYTLVSDVKPDPLELIELESSDIKLYQGTDEVEYGYGMHFFDIKGIFKNLEAYKWDHMLNQVDWYASNTEYNMPMPKDEDFNLEDDLLLNSYYFPLFPRDYELIDNETIYKFGTSEVNFNKLPQFAGRHIIFTVTPAAKSGKLGIQEVTKPIFTSALPIIDNIVMHFDAAYIDVLDSNEVQKINNDWFLNKWLDISSIIGNSTPNQAAIYGTNGKPIVKRTDIGLGFIGQYVRFVNNEYIEIKNQATSGDNITIIAVVKNRSKTESTAYLKNGDITLDLDPNIENKDYQWNVEIDVITSESNDFIFGGKSADIAEIIIYKGLLDEPSEKAIEDYLFGKYQSPTVTGEIVQLLDMEKEIFVGDSFELPQMVLADMERGTQKYVSVSWTGEYFTDSEGVYIITGSALANPTKKMTYTLTVIPN